MKRLLLGGVLLALLLPLQATAQSAFGGTWKVDISKVQSSTKPTVVTLKGGEYSCNCTPPITIRADGADHAVTGHARFDTDAVKIVNDHTIVETAKKNGAVVNTRTTKVAADGKTATFESVSTRESGTTTVKGTLNRVAAGAAGSHAAAGSWVVGGYQSASEGVTTVTYKVDGDTISMNDPNGESYTARLDGKPVPYKGDPGTDTIAVKMVGSALEETAMLAGKTTSIATSTLSADGKTMTTVIHNVPANRDMTLVSMKQ
ncbi:hypothetical protein BJI69_15835 [Luteibacter rhizovicinus DSM 16549]|uniref:Uncharacterized protein n=1 Tax=Luteibacter rhizovicinus DSM 16549 TaxID=1440763 RepID=A0A0G9HF83_9GAMM|nr:hypothetical protein [Luteibacter rhizovicinus]APG05222.1 hypothetical protein BJI69_15835 [Luteibacter rhizovicinus DSM 16549]KLD67844.1 hypothetical protein Y883_05490 [Luteibacter rhizovicinus DSM 16549]KLD74001.1 hypothetical protein Y886_35090 [Xanthomonas hyacinthi DSM 19077]